MDDAERSLQQPLVSLSLGCDAIFLMGHASKAQAPTALLLRSGDAVVLSGPARRCYHGVPRVLTGQAAIENAVVRRRSRIAHQQAIRSDRCSSDVREGSDDDEFQPFASHMQRCRINISIRDTR